MQITGATPAIADGAFAAFSAILCGGVGQAFDFEESPEDQPYARRGWLLGVSGIYAADTKEDDLESSLGNPAGAPVNLSLKNTFGVKSQAGQRCHPRFSAEVEGTVFLGGAVGEKISIDLEPLVVTTNLKDHSGLGLSQTDTMRGVVMRFGGGLDFYATKQIVLTVGVDYLLPFGELEDFDYVSIAWGLRYRF